MTPPFWPTPAPYAGTTLDPGLDPLVVLVLVLVGTVLGLTFMALVVALGLTIPLGKRER